MAYATSITISTGNKVSMNYQSQDVSISLTYQLERDDTDLLALVERKAVEVEKAHRTAWKRIRDERLAEQALTNGNGNSSNGTPTVTGINAATEANDVASDESSPNGNHVNGTAIPELAVPVRASRASRSAAKAAPEVEPQPDAPAATVAPAPVATQTEGPASPAPRAGIPRLTMLPSQRPVTETQRRAIGSLSARLGLSEEELNRRTDIRFGKRTLGELTELEANNLILDLQRNAPVIAGTRPGAVTAPTNGSGEPPHHEESQGGNGHGRKTNRSAARS